MLKVVVNGKAVQGAKVVVHNGDKIILSDAQTGQSPKKIIIKRVDKNLQIFEEGASEPSLVLENYYNDGVPAQLTGIDASGGYVNYAAIESGSMELLSSPLEATAAGEPAVAATAGISTGTMIGLGALGVVGIAVAAGGGSSATTDTVAPAAPSIALVTDSGVSSTDGITNIATVNVSGLESGATWQYQVDSGAWTAGIGSSFSATAGTHTYAVRQTDTASNVSTASSALSITLDTIAPVYLSAVAHSADKTIVLTFDSPLDTAHIPATTDFAITTGGVANTVSSVSVSGSTVTLTMTNTFIATSAVTLSYTDASGDTINAIQDISGNDTLSVTVSSGLVADGYVRGAQIWIDTNKDGTADYNTGITTDESGNFFLPSGTPSGSIVAIGGVNIDTGVANTMPLRAPEGSTVINPLTTLVQAIIQANPSTSVSDASTSVVAALGLTAGTNLTTYDPIEAAQSSDPIVAANALVAQQAAATVATIIALAAESAADSTAATTATNTIISNIVTQIQASETSTVVLDLGDSTTITNMTAGVTLSDEVQSAIADASTAIQAATVLSEITTAQSVALDTVAVSASTITATAITSDTTPAIKVNLNTTSTDGTAAISGDTVLLKSDGVQIASATLSELDIARGYITINSPVLSEGVHAISAVIVDQAGNISNPYSSVNVTVDTTPTTPSAINRIATDNIINGTEKELGVVLSGTIASGSTVTVEGNAATVSGTTWSYTLTASDYTTMGEGSETIDVVVTAANSSTATSTRDIIIDTIIPTTPTISAISTDNAINTAEKNGNVAISGTAEANALITLTLSGGNIHAVNADSSGAWTYALTEADYTSIGTGATIKATAKDAAGNVSAVASQAITVDTGAPLLTVNSVATDNIINISEKAATVTVTGANEAGSTVTVNGASATVTGTTWSYVLDATAIGTMGERSETLTIITTDTAGNATTRTKTINVDTIITAPTATLTDSGSSNSDSVTNSAALTFSAKAADVTRTFTVDGGSVSATYIVPTADGSHTVVVTDTDTAGNTATLTKTFTLDTTIAAPAASLTSDSGSSNSDNITNSAALTFNTAAVDVTRSFVVDGGSASATYTAPTADGSHTVTVTDIDTAGNTATVTKTLVIDTIAPSFTSGTAATVSENTTAAVYAAVATGAASYSLGGTDAALFSVNSVSGAVTFKIAPDFENPALGNSDNIYDITLTATDTAGNTSNQAVAITVQNVDVTIGNVATDNVISAAEKATGVTLTGNNEPGITSLTVNGATATVNGTSWSYALDTAAITAMGEGTETLTIVSGGTTITKDITIDTVAPTLIIEDVSTANIVNNAEALTGGPITGTTTAEDGRIVTVKVDGTTLGTTVVTSGVWSLAVASSLTTQLSQGSHTVTAEVSDLAGNPITATKTFAVDTLAPTISIANIAGDNIINATENAILTRNASGTSDAENGSTVVVKTGTTTLGTTTVQNGIWNLDFTVANQTPDGSYTRNVEITDLAGNTATATKAFTVDVMAPTGTISNASADNILNATENVAGSKTITGTSNAENGSTVVVKIDGNTKGTTTVTDGAWSLTYATTGVLSDGTHTRSAEITDIAGNVGIVSKTFTVDTAISTPTIAMDNLFSTFTVANIDTGTAWQYKVGIGDWQTGTDTKIVLSDGPGTYQISVRETDTAGNVGEIINSTVVVTPVVTAISPSTPGELLNYTVTNSLSNTIVSLYGLTNGTYYEIGGAFSAANPVFTGNHGIQPGTYELFYRVRDSQTLLWEPISEYIPLHQTVTIIGVAPTIASINSCTINDLDNSVSYSSGDKITLNFSELVQPSLLTLDDLVLSNGHSFGAGAILTTENSFWTRNVVVTLGSDATIVAGDTITIAKTEVIDMAGITAANDLMFTVPAVNVPEISTYTQTLFDTASLNYTLHDITGLPINQTYTNGYSAVTFTNTNSGIIVDTYAIGTQIGTVQLQNGSLMVTLNNSAMQQGTFEYKEISSTADTIILGLVTTDASSLNNWSIIPPILTMTNTAVSQVSQVLPMTGTMELWQTEVWSNSVMGNIRTVKTTINFDNSQVIYTGVDGSIQAHSFTRDGNIIIVNEITPDGNYEMKLELVGTTSNGIDLFRSTTTYSDGFTMGSADGATSISNYLTTHNNQISTGGTLVSDGSGGYLYNNGYSTYPATLENNALVVNFMTTASYGESYITTYFVNSEGTIEAHYVNTNIKISSYGESAPYAYTYHNESNYYGTSYPDTIVGTDDVDIITGSGGNDMIDVVTDTAVDTLSYSTYTNEGHDTITNFNSSMDKIYLSVDQNLLNSNFNSYVSSIVQNGTDTDVSLSSGAIITLKNTTASDITASDFTGYHTNQAPYITNLNWNNSAPIMYVAKNQALNIDLKNYVSDPDGDTVTITVNSSDLPAGLSIVNGIITGSTTATSGSLNITLSDGHGGISTQTINLSAIDDPTATGLVYGSAATIDPTTNFFGVDSYDMGIWSLNIGDVVGGSTTEGSFASYNYVNGAYVADTNDAGNFDVVSTTTTGATLTHTGTTETIVFSDAKAVTSVDGVATTGLNGVTATWTVTAQTNTVITATDWWTENYTYWNGTTSVPITTLTGLRDAFMGPNWGGDVYINENTRVNLVGTTGATSGTLVSMVWDGTYNTYTDQNGVQQISKHLVDGVAISGGTWAIETISGVEYLTVTVPNQGVHAFKVENGVLMSTEIAAAGTSYSETLFCGVDLATFQNTLISATINHAPTMSLTGTPATIPEDGERILDVASLLVAKGATDVDGDPLGIAITAVNMSEGSYFYSTDGGTTWNDATSPISSVSATHALLIPTYSDAGGTIHTKLKFVPNPNLNSTNDSNTVDDTTLIMQLKVWDMTTGTSFGYADTTTGTAFSTTTAAKVIITPEGTVITPPVTPTDVVIISSTLTATETDIPAFPVDTIFTDGYVTMVFSSATAGTITEPNGLVHTLTLANGIASASVEGTTYSYKMLSGSGDMIILGQTDTNLTVEMNGETQGPPPIWTLISTTATVDPFPSSGIMTLWETSTDNFGDQYAATWAKTVFDFTNHTAQDYFIDGTASTAQTFTVDTATNTMHIAATASNSRTSDVQLMGGYNGFYAFESHYTESYTWGQNSADNSTDMTNYLTDHSDILWSENGQDNNNNGTAYDYGMVTRTGGTVSGFTEYTSSIADHSDSTQNWSAVSATLSDTNTLVINEGDRTSSYSIANNEMNVTQVGTEVFSFTQTNPFSYTYAYEMDMGNGTVGIGLHDGMALDVADLNYNHTLYGIDSVQDTGANAITIAVADVLAQAVSDGQGHYNVGINGGTNDTVTIGSGWTQNGTYADANSSVVYDVYTQDIAQLMISQGTQVL